MKKFLVLYKAPVEEFQKMMANSTPEMQKKGTEEWIRWMTENKNSLADGGAPLGKTKVATVSGVTDVRNDIGGYSVIQAETHDDAAAIYKKDFPHFNIPGASAEIMEIMPMGGM